MSQQPGHPFTLIARGPMPAPRKLKIAAFDGKSVFARPEKARTIGNCVDYGQAVSVTCDCARRIVHVHPERFLRLPSPPDEATPVRELTRWMRCKSCDERGIARTDPVGYCVPGMIPRVRSIDPEITSRGTSSTLFVGGTGIFGKLPEKPHDDGPKGPRGRRRRFKAR